MSVTRLYVFFAIGLAMLFSVNAVASDQIICDSKTFKAAFAVGSDGYVSNMELSDLSKKYFSEVLEITDMPKNRRHISIEERRVDVKATVDKKIINVFVINIRNGKGYIKLDSLKEKMTCDWDI
jgi:hypothetical protein